jgi:adenylate cyclase
MTGSSRQQKSLIRAPPRRVRAHAFIDVADYPRLLDANKRGTLAELASIRLKLMRPTISAYNGNVIKNMRDATLIEFASVEEACAGRSSSRLRCVSGTPRASLRF